VCAKECLKYDPISHGSADTPSSVTVVMHDAIMDMVMYYGPALFMSAGTPISVTKDMNDDIMDMVM
jgi:hypothetical protein